MEDKRHGLNHDGMFIGFATLAPEHSGLEFFIQALDKVLHSGMRLDSLFRDDGQHLPSYVYCPT